MPDIKLSTLHLSFMEDMLPVGIAIVDRAKKGGVSKVMESFTAFQDPLQMLRAEGSLSAKLIRDKLDEINPGLGNPVVEVDLTVNTHEYEQDNFNDTSLVYILKRIDDRIEAIQDYLDDSIDVTA